MPAAARVLLRLVAHEVRRHREQPRSLTHDVTLSRRSEKGFLRDLLGPVAVAQSPRQIADERLVEISEEAVEIDHFGGMGLSMSTEHGAVSGPSLSLSTEHGAFSSTCTSSSSCWKRLRAPCSCSALLLVTGITSLERVAPCHQP